jgi:signal transduction histidine kinase
MVERTLLRIAQEAFANIARHSAATQAELQFEHSSADAAQLVIADNGNGFAPADQPAGLGLQSMRERAESLPGGAFTLETQPQQGTRIVVRFKTQCPQ